MPQPPARADWREAAGFDERVKSALSSRGWRFTEDGTALDPKTKSAATADALTKAIIDLRPDAQRAALEAVNLMLAKPRLDAADREKLGTLESELPPRLFAALMDPKSPNADLRRMADAELATIALYFDGSRSLDDRRAAATPVRAALPGERVELPYFSKLEKSVCEKLSAGWVRTIGADPFGHKFLEQFAGKDGKPVLPPIVLEHQGGASTVAHYDPRRRAISVDRSLAVEAIAETLPSAQRDSFKAAMTTDDAVLKYLDLHPNAIAAVVAQNDVTIVHELTHALQDQRDTVFREMARDNLPDAQIIDYEEEAYKTQNLYIHSKLKNDPTTAIEPEQLAGYIAMMVSPDIWADNLAAGLRGTSPSRALSLADVKSVMKARYSMVKMREAATAEKQTAKRLDLTAAGHGRKALRDAGEDLQTRLAAVDESIRGNQVDRYRVLTVYYLEQARRSTSTARTVFLDKAKDMAEDSGSTELIDKVRAERAKGE